LTLFHLALLNDSLYCFVLFAFLVNIGLSFWVENWKKYTWFFLVSFRILSTYVFILYIVRDKVLKPRIRNFVSSFECLKKNSKTTKSHWDVARSHTLLRKMQQAGQLDQLKEYHMSYESLKFINIVNELFSQLTSVRWI
jgi:hypothetical protein